MVLAMYLEMFGQVGNPLAKYSDLNLGRAGIVRMKAIRTHDLALLVLRQCQGTLHAITDNISHQKLPHSSNPFKTIDLQGCDSATNALT